ncbi:MAG: hypothetical protein WDN23_04925 [Edaphobacter sp.]
MNVLNYPLFVFLITFLGLWLAAWLGVQSHKWRPTLEDDDLRTDFSVVQAATLTLLGLIIGFSFSMATGRYELRKNFEATEASAIGTEYLRADLLPGDEASQVRALLKEYTAQRVRFYRSNDWNAIDKIRADTAKIQAKLWKTVSATANEQATPIRAMTVTGMNDVLNSEEYTQAAWWNRIPGEAWSMMFAIALFCNWLVGYGARKVHLKLLMVLPTVVAIAFFLISDIDSPRGGMIQVKPLDLLRLQAGLETTR